MHVGRARSDNAPSWAAPGGRRGDGVCAWRRARRSDDDDDDKNSIWNLDKRIIDSIVSGIGLRSPTRHDDRVSRTLAAGRAADPQSAAARSRERRPQRRVAGRSGPEAPPGGASPRRKEKRQRATTPTAEARNLTPSELNRPGAGAGRAAGAPASDGNDEARRQQRCSPSELGYIGGLFSSGSLSGHAARRKTLATFTSEPPRTSLTAPPAGYQTPSPGAALWLSQGKGSAQRSRRWTPQWVTLARRNEPAA